MTVRAAEFYSGIGGLHRALERSAVDGRVVRAFDWDQSACRVYDANHSGCIVRKLDISTLDAATLAEIAADLWLLSPACQPYTVLNPKAKGVEDPRAQSFLHVVQTILPEMAKIDALPTRMLIENVAGFETSTTRTILIDTLRSLGYATLELLLTPFQFGIPNSRLRYYLLAKKNPLKFSGVLGDIVQREIPGRMMAEVEVPRLCDAILDAESGAEYAITDRILMKWGRLFDIVLPSSRRTCCFTRGYTRIVERSGSILQMNETLDTTETFDRFLSMKAEGNPDAVRILDSLCLRYLTPSELLRLFSFDSPRNKIFIWPENISKKTKYRLIGNSVNVCVVQNLIEYLFVE